MRPERGKKPRPTARAKKSSDTTRRFFAADGAGSEGAGARERATEVARVAALGDGSPHGTRTPSSAGANKAPTSAGANKAPTSAGANKAPSSAGATKAPTSAGANKAATSAGSTKTPTSAGATKAPTSAGATKAPTSAGATKAPTSAGATKAPTSAGATKAATSAGATKTPTSAGATKAPTSAGATKAPSSAGATKAATSAGATKAATSAGATKAPTSAGATKAATSAGSTKTPTSAGATKAPTSAGATKAPTSAGATKAATSAGATKAPTSAPPQPRAGATKPAARAPRPKAVAAAPKAVTPPPPAASAAPSLARPKVAARARASSDARDGSPSGTLPVDRLPRAPHIDSGLLAEALFAPAPAFEVALDDDFDTPPVVAPPERRPLGALSERVAVPTRAVAPEPATEVFADDDSQPPPARTLGKADASEPSDPELYSFEDDVERLHRDGSSATDGAAREHAARLMESLAGSLGGAPPDRPSTRAPLETVHDVDDFGLDRAYVARTRDIVHGLYRRWFRTLVRGIEQVPETGPVLLVANHGGVLPWDGLMLRTAMELEHPSHRELRWLVDDSTFHAPFVGTAATRLGAVRACPENAERLLGEGRLVAVFPEGDKGATKPFARRYELQRFGRGGYVKLALRTRATIVPVAIVGAEEAHPMLFSTGRLAKLFGLSWLPVTPTFPWLGPLGLVPLPSRWVILFGEPVSLDEEPPGAEHDEVLVGRINEEIREAVQDLVRKALSLRPAAYFG